jgi:hypothetical protein
MFTLIASLLGFGTCHSDGRESQTRRECIRKKLLGAAVDTTAICCICKYRRYVAKHEIALDEVARAMFSKQRPLFVWSLIISKARKLHNKYIKYISEYVRFVAYKYYKNEEVKIRVVGRGSLYF